MPIDPQVLEDYIATRNNPKYKSVAEVNAKFPEFKDYNPQLLEDYVATRNNPKYKTVSEVNAKFPEFFNGSVSTPIIPPKINTGNAASTSIRKITPVVAPTVSDTETDVSTRKTPVTDTPINQFTQGIQNKTAFGETVNQMDTENIVKLPVEKSVFQSDTDVPTNKTVGTQALPVTEMKSALYGLTQPELNDNAGQPITPEKITPENLMANPDIGNKKNIKNAFDTGNLDEAKNMASNLDPKDKYRWDVTAKVYAQQKDYNSSDAAISIGLRLDPNNEDLKQLRLENYIKSGNNEKSKEYSLQLVADNKIKSNLVATDYLAEYYRAQFELDKTQASKNKWDYYKHKHFIDYLDQKHNMTESEYQSANAKAMDKVGEGMKTAINTALTGGADKMIEGGLNKALNKSATPTEILRTLLGDPTSLAATTQLGDAIDQFIDNPNIKTATDIGKKEVSSFVGIGETFIGATFAGGANVVDKALFGIIPEAINAISNDPQSNLYNKGLNLFMQPVSALYKKFTGINDEQFEKDRQDNPTSLLNSALTIGDMAGMMIIHKIGNGSLGVFKGNEKLYGDGLGLTPKETELLPIVNDKIRNNDKLSSSEKAIHDKAVQGAYNINKLINSPQIKEGDINPAQTELLLDVLKTASEKDYQKANKFSEAITVLTNEVKLKDADKRIEQKQAETGIIPDPLKTYKNSNVVAFNLTDQVNHTFETVNKLFVDGEKIKVEKEKQANKMRGNKQNAMQNGKLGNQIQTKENPIDGNPNKAEIKKVMEDNIIPIEDAQRTSADLGEIILGLENDKNNPNRESTLKQLDEQIKAIKEQKAMIDSFVDNRGYSSERIIEFYDKKLKEEAKNDNKNITGVSGKVGIGENPIEAKLDEGGSEEKISPSRIFQTSQGEGKVIGDEIAKDIDVDNLIEENTISEIKKYSKERGIEIASDELGAVYEMFQRDLLDNPDKKVIDVLDETLLNHEKAKDKERIFEYDTESELQKADEEYEKSTTEEKPVVESGIHLEISYFVKKALEKGEKKSVIILDENGNPIRKSIEFSKEDADIELYYLESLAKKGKLTTDIFAESYFAQKIDVGLLALAKEEISKNQVGFIEKLKKSFEQGEEVTTETKENISEGKLSAKNAVTQVLADDAGVIIDKPKFKDKEQIAKEAEIMEQEVGGEQVLKDFKKTGLYNSVTQRVVLNYVDKLLARKEKAFSEYGKVLRGEKEGDIKELIDAQDKSFSEYIEGLQSLTEMGTDWSALGIDRQKYFERHFNADNYNAQNESMGLLHTDLEKAKNAEKFDAIKVADVKIDDIRKSIESLETNENTAELQKLIKEYHDKFYGEGKKTTKKTKTEKNISVSDAKISTYKEQLKELRKGTWSQLNAMMPMNKLFEYGSIVGQLGRERIKNLALKGTVGIERVISLIKGDLKEVDIDFTDKQIIESILQKGQFKKETVQKELSNYKKTTKELNDLLNVEKELKTHEEKRVKIEGKLQDDVNKSIDNEANKIQKRLETLQGKLDELRKQEKPSEPKEKTTKLVSKKEQAILDEIDKEKNRLGNVKRLETLQGKLDYLEENGVLPKTDVIKKGTTPEERAINFQIRERLKQLKDSKDAELQTNNAIKDLNKQITEKTKELYKTKDLSEKKRISGEVDGLVTELQSKKDTLKSLKEAKLEERKNNGFVEKSIEDIIKQKIKLKEKAIADAEIKRRSEPSSVNKKVLEKYKELNELEGVRKRQIYDLTKQQQDYIYRQKAIWLRFIDKYMIGTVKTLILTGVNVIGKIAHFLTATVALTHISELAGAGWSQVLPRLAAEAPREGGFSWDALKKGDKAVGKSLMDMAKQISKLKISEALKSEMLQKLFKGENTTDYLFNNVRLDKTTQKVFSKDAGKIQKIFSYTEDIGDKVFKPFKIFKNSHGFLKEARRIQEIEISTVKRLEKISKKENRTPTEQEYNEARKKAFEDGQRAVLQDENMLVNSIKAISNTMKNFKFGKDKKEAEQFIPYLSGSVIEMQTPVLRAPSNAIRAFFRASLGLTRLIDAIPLAMSKTLRNKTPEWYKDNVMRNLKDGTFGGITLALGLYYFLNNDDIKENDKGELVDKKTGEVMWYGSKNIGHTPFGNPLIMAYEISKELKDDKATTMDVILNPLTKLIYEAPAIKEMDKFSNQKLDKWTYGQLNRYIPQLIKDIAKMGDDDGEQKVPNGFVESVFNVNLPFLRKNVKSLSDLQQEKNVSNITHKSELDKIAAEEKEIAEHTVKLKQYMNEHNGSSEGFVPDVAYQNIIIRRYKESHFTQKEKKSEAEILAKDNEDRIKKLEQTQAIESGETPNFKTKNSRGSRKKGGHKTSRSEMGTKKRVGK